MKKFLLSAAMAVACTLGCLAANGNSKIVTDTIDSKLLGAKRAYTVLLPESFDTDSRREDPVLYLLHGMYGVNDDWTVQGNLKSVYDRLIGSHEIGEMVIVMPDAGGQDPSRQPNGYFDIPGWNYEQFFFTELMPEVEKRYRIKGDRTHRALAGLSMGGGGTTVYAQRHPDMFGSAYAMSALMSLPGDRNGDNNDPQGLIGKFNKSVVDHDCVKFVEEADDARKAALRSVKWFVDCGDDDFLLNCNLDFYRAMRRQGIPCEMRVRDGGHDWEYWHTALYTALPFAFRNFSK